MSRAHLKSWLTFATKTHVRSSNAKIFKSTLNRSSSVVPQDYDDLLSYYTRRGYRVIAMAGKSIEGLSWLKAQRMKR
jgi:hypothetical protein